jgi:quercetin dioxygenase-like cupin family protein
MDNLFPEPIRNLPLADMPFAGVTAHLSQADTHQIIFMHFAEDTPLPEHAHAPQWGIVLEGKIDMTIEGVSKTYTKGDRYFIPDGAKHSGKIHAGYADMTFFAQKDRYSAK